MRAAEGTGRARALSLWSRAEKRSRGDAQKHPTHRAAEAGSGQEPTRVTPAAGPEPEAAPRDCGRAGGGWGRAAWPRSGGRGARLGQARGPARPERGGAAAAVARRTPRLQAPAAAQARQGLQVPRRSLLGPWPARGRRGGSCRGGSRARSGCREGGGGGNK